MIHSDLPSMKVLVDVDDYRTFPEFPQAKISKRDFNNLEQTALYREFTEHRRRPFLVCSDLVNELETRATNVYCED